MSDAAPYLGLMPGAFELVPEWQPEPAFPRNEYRDRLRRVRAAMAEQRIDVLYVTMPEHVCYLHGFFASWYKANGPMRYPQLYGTAIHVDSDEFIHFNNPTEQPILAKYSISTDNRFFPSREAAPNLAFIIDNLKAKEWLGGTVALEYWSYLPNRAISTMLEGAFLAEGCRVVDGSAILRTVRRVKSAAEIAYIEKAVALADVGHETIRRTMQRGMTELELFGEVMREMMAAGSEFPALIPIFNSVPLHDGESMTTGHAMAGRKKLAPGEMLKADLCGVYNRYHGNVMRGYYLGEPSAALLDRHRRAAGVFPVMASEVKAGMSVREVMPCSAAISRRPDCGMSRAGRSAMRSALACRRIGSANSISTFAMTSTSIGYLRKIWSLTSKAYSEPGSWIHASTRKPARVFSPRLQWS
jgi:Xaa-Pro aminopeptidase